MKDIMYDHYIAIGWSIPKSVISSSFIRKYIEKTSLIR